MALGSSHLSWYIHAALSCEEILPSSWEPQWCRLCLLRRWIVTALLLLVLELSPAPFAQVALNCLPVCATDVSIPNLLLTIMAWLHCLLLEAVISLLITKKFSQLKNFNDCQMTTTLWGKERERGFTQLEGTTWPCCRQQTLTLLRTCPGLWCVFWRAMCLHSHPRSCWCSTFLC